jgi:penicillin-binding protein 1A
MNLVDATINSVNVVFAQLGLDVGPDNFAKTAYQMGITSPLGIISNPDGSTSPCKSGPSCSIPPADAIGGLSEGITPLEHADAYATLASGGVHHDATAIGKVVFPNGDVDQTNSDSGNRVLTPGQAYTVTHILEQVITSGTGVPASIGCSTGSAGKTGTSEGLSDAWFAGYTPRYSTAVWVGHPNSRDYTGFGGPTAGPIWANYMSAANPTCEPFPIPSSLPSLSQFFSDHTASAPSLKPTTPTSPTTTTPTTKGHNGTGGGNGNYNPNLYQGGNNGIQTNPVTPPAPGGGGNPGGGGGGGGGGSPGGGGIGPGAH